MERPMSVKILLVDDHAMVRSGLKALLLSRPGHEVLGEAHNGRAAVKMVGELSPDVVVMDLRMPDLNGIDACRQIVAAKPDVKVVGLSGSSDERATVEMLRAGASGYVLKDSAFDELIAAIATVIKGKVYLSPAITGGIVENYIRGGHDGVATAFGTLSPREREVLQLIAEGKATKEVANKLDVSIKTAETHRRNLMAKLQVDSVAELTKYAIREGLTSV
jgi:DNA-binding NarL/FixJ family response regulator